jgi:hypothetical protein
VTNLGPCRFCGAAPGEEHDRGQWHVYDNQPSEVTLADLRPGDVIFPTITGYAGALVGAGQIILGDATPSEWRVRHVAMVVEASHTTGRGDHTFNPMIVQAMPHGAEEVELTPVSLASGFPILRPAYASGISGTREGMLEAARCARRYVGVPYSFADYLAIAGRHLLALKPTDRTPLDRYVTTSKRMICSQLVDQALADAGYHVFDDGRIPQDVTPAALYRQLLTLPGTKRLR